MSGMEKHECNKIDRYIDGELSECEKASFEKHLEICSICREYCNGYRMLRNQLHSLQNEYVPDETDLRIRYQLHEKCGLIHDTPEIFTIESAAHFLSIPVVEFIQLLDQIPSFEIGGHIRFRKDKLLRWIEEQEKKMSWERERVTLQKKIIQFPGGKS